MNRTISRIGSLCLLTLPLCFAVPKPSSKAIAASEEVNITSFDCTYNSETSKYDCLVEGVNNTEKYMVLSELKMIANSNDYFPIKTDNPFFTSLLIKPGESFEAKYETTLENSINDVRFYPSLAIGEINDAIFVKCNKYEIEKDKNSTLYCANFYYEFDRNIYLNGVEGDRRYYYEYRTISFLKYDSLDYCVTSRYVETFDEETIISLVVLDQQIEASEISFENVILVEKKRKSPFSWTDEDRANLIRVFKYILLGILCSIIVLAVSLITYFVIRKKKKASNK